MKELNINLPPFYVGQKVVYITGNNMPKGVVDTVIGVDKQSCGCYEILLRNRKSERVNTKQYTIYECNDCNADLPIQEYRNGWWSAKSFRPLQEATMPLLTYSKVLEEVTLSSN